MHGSSSTGTCPLSGLAEIGSACASEGPRVDPGIGVPHGKVGPVDRSAPLNESRTSSP